MKVILNTEKQEAEALDEDKLAGFCQYEIKDDKLWEITHTVVKPEYGGQGLAAKLVDKVVDEARENDVKIIPTCSYAKKKFDENPDKYGDVAK